MPSQTAEQGQCVDLAVFPPPAALMPIGPFAAIMNDVITTAINASVNASGVVLDLPSFFSNALSLPMITHSAITGMLAGHMCPVIIGDNVYELTDSFINTHNLRCGMRSKDIDADTYALSEFQIGVYQPPLKLEYDVLTLNNLNRVLDQKKGVIARAERDGVSAGDNWKVQDIKHANAGQGSHHSLILSSGQLEALDDGAEALSVQPWAVAHLEPLTAEEPEPENFGEFMKTVGSKAMHYVLHKAVLNEFALEEQRAPSSAISHNLDLNRYHHKLAKFTPGWKSAPPGAVAYTASVAVRPGQPSVFAHTLADALYDLHATIPPADRDKKETFMNWKIARTRPESDDEYTIVIFVFATPPKYTRPVKRFKDLACNAAEYVLHLDHAAQIVYSGVAFSDCVGRQSGARKSFAMATRSKMPIPYWTYQLAIN
jgi:hypothetical protein